MDDDELVPEHRARWVRSLFLVGSLLAVGLLLVGWNRLASTPRLCSSCHAMDSAVLSAARSVHSDLSCLDCHTRPGLLGAVRYIPALARETVATLTRWNVSHGVLDARPCEDCHTDLTTAATLKPTHDGASDCASCHGQVSHPPLLILEERPSPLTGQPHPQGYVQLHGRDVVDDPASCQTCHKPTFCQACHFKAVFPHPDGWIGQHGLVEQQEGAEACTSCHPTTFCVGCHGTEIPHLSNWLDEHWRSLQDAPITPCLLCHPKTDCTTCHSEHGVHVSQTLYLGGSS
jgi:hypothetical protein